LAARWLLLGICGSCADGAPIPIQEPQESEGDSCDELTIETERVTQQEEAKRIWTRVAEDATQVFRSCSESNLDDLARAVLVIPDLKKRCASWGGESELDRYGEGSQN